MSFEFCNPSPNANSQMPSPSKLAAQRIYSSPRNRITFHDALQGGVDAFVKPAPIVCSNNAANVSLTPTVATQPNNDLQQNDSQFHLLQQQIDLLRSMIVQMSQSKREASVLTPPPIQNQPHVTILPLTVAPQPTQQQRVVVDEPTTDTAPAVVSNLINRGTAFLSENQSRLPILNCFSCAGTISWWQVLLFAVVFIIGLIQVINWIIEKITNLVSPKPATQMSRSRSSSSQTF